MPDALFKGLGNGVMPVSPEWDNIPTPSANLEANLPELYLDTLSELVEKLHNTEQAEHLDCDDRIEQLKLILSQAAAKLGFKHFAYHVARSSITGSTTGRLPYMISNYPDSWVRHYFRERYLDEDPVVSEFLRRREPFLWSEIAQPEKLSRRQRRLLAEARDAGITDGITVPIHHRGVIAAVSLVPCEPEGPALTTIRQHQRMLYVMALHYHPLAHRSLLEKSLAGDSPRRRSLLSPREKQVLAWAAKGKSNWEIASLLNISCKSAESHMEGAKRKLQAFNRTHAVAKAIMLGLLAVD
jgi:LuxR family transcriptional regulator, activator of conjugal transfer of Ti plasmids